MVYAARWGSRPATVLFKYISQTCTTLRILFRERPRAIFVMLPPVVAAFPILLYAKLFGARVFLDSHTAAFLGSAWSRLLFLHRFASWHATATIVTGDHLREIVASWNAPVQLVTDVPVVFAEPEEFRVNGSFAVAVISSFNRDEPIRELIEAAHRLSDVEFYVTGNTKKLDPQLIESKPGNLHFTGFISDGQYVSLLQNCDAVAALTTRDHTMQRGAYEAIYLKKPVITSDFPILRSAFSKGTVHVAPTVDAITEGIREMKQHVERYRAGASELCYEKHQRWLVTATQLKLLAGIEEPHDTSLNSEEDVTTTAVGACSR